MSIPVGLIDSSEEFGATQSRQAASVVAPPVSSSELGAYKLSEGQGQAPPFFQDAANGLVLSRPAHIRDYQPDAAAFPFRSQSNQEISPSMPQPSSSPTADSVSPYAASPIVPSHAERHWLLEQEQAARSQAQVASDAALLAERAARKHPPTKFESKLGFRPEEEPKPLLAERSKDFGKHFHADGVSREFFNPGQGRFVSENGVANSQRYYSLARPLGGRLKTHTTSKTTPFGYSFDMYTSRP